MKKFVLFLAAIFLVNVATPTQSHAGLLIAGGSDYIQNDFLRNFGRVVGVTTMVGAALGAWALLIPFWPLGVGLLILDGDSGEANPADLSARYSFLEDRNVRENLHHAISKKIKDAPTVTRVIKSADGSTAISEFKQVSLSELEIREILAPADLTEAEVQQIVLEVGGVTN